MTSFGTESAIVRPSFRYNILNSCRIGMMQNMLGQFPIYKRYKLQKKPIAKTHSK